MNNRALSVRSLSKRFGDTLAVDQVSVDIEPGSFVGIIGRSGAGKSTLLRMINRLNEPTQGEIIFGGEVITGLKGAQLNQWRRRCAMIFQQFNLVGRLDVLTNVLMGRLTSIPTWRSLLTIWRDADKLEALDVLDRFGMADFAAQRCDQLSGGQQQRVAICRALVQHPEIILADEPTAPLDSERALGVMRILNAMAKQANTAIIVVTHDEKIIPTFKRIYHIRDGETHEEMGEGRALN